MAAIMRVQVAPKSSQTPPQDFNALPIIPMAIDLCNDDDGDDDDDDDDDNLVIDKISLQSQFALTDDINIKDSTADRFDAPGYIVDNGTMNGPIGSSLSIVKSATHIGTKKPVVIKFVPTEIWTSAWSHQLDILRATYHPNIVIIREVFTTPKYHGIVMQRAGFGGHLIRDLTPALYMGEYDSRIVFRQLLSAMIHLHSVCPTNSDACFLKVDNVFFDERFNVQLIPYGRDESSRTDKVPSTPYSLPHYHSPACFAPPEVVGCKEYNSRHCDVYSLGVVLHWLLSGKLPYDGFDVTSIHASMLMGQRVSLQDVTPELSKDCLNLLEGLLSVKPGLRLALDQVFAHPWLGCSIEKWVPAFITDNNFRDEYHQQHISALESCRIAGYSIDSVLESINLCAVDECFAFYSLLMPLPKHYDENFIAEPREFLIKNEEKRSPTESPSTNMITKSVIGLVSRKENLQLPAHRGKRKLVSSRKRHTPKTSLVKSEELPSLAPKITLDTPASPDVMKLWQRAVLFRKHAILDSEKNNWPEGWFHRLRDQPPPRSVILMSRKITSIIDEIDRRSINRNSHGMKSRRKNNKWCTCEGSSDNVTENENIERDVIGSRLASNLLMTQVGKLKAADSLSLREIQKPFFPPNSSNEVVYKFRSNELRNSNTNIRSSTSLYRCNSGVLINPQIDRAYSPITTQNFESSPNEINDRESALISRRQRRRGNRPIQMYSGTHSEDTPLVAPRPRINVSADTYKKLLFVCERCNRFRQPISENESRDTKVQTKLEAKIKKKMKLPPTRKGPIDMYWNASQMPWYSSIMKEFGGDEPIVRDVPIRSLNNVVTTTYHSPDVIIAMLIDVFSQFELNVIIGSMNSSSSPYMFLCSVDDESLLFEFEICKMPTTLLNGVFLKLYSGSRASFDVLKRAFIDALK